MQIENKNQRMLLIASNSIIKLNCAYLLAAYVNEKSTSWTRTSRNIWKRCPIKKASKQKATHFTRVMRFLSPLMVIKLASNASNQAPHNPDLIESAGRFASSRDWVRASAIGGSDANLRCALRGFVVRARPAALFVVGVLFWVVAIESLFALSPSRARNKCNIHLGRGRVFRGDLSIRLMHFPAASARPKMHSAQGVRTLHDIARWRRSPFIYSVTYYFEETVKNLNVCQNIKVKVKAAKFS